MTNGEGKTFVVGICADCGSQITMTQGDKDFWDKLIKEQGYKFPKRCKPCREKKRKIQNTPLFPEAVHEKLKIMMEKAINDEYEGRGDVLAAELSALGVQVLLLKPSNARL